MRLFYFDIREMDKDAMNCYLRLLPVFMQDEVVRYKSIADQKSRLVARLMLRESLIKSGSTTLISSVRRDINNKPYIKGWQHFNISHSGDMVIFCHSETEMGADIEKIVCINYGEILPEFHPAERAFILSAHNIGPAFYGIWVRKESLLKAVGVGLMDGLCKINCIEDKIEHKGKIWHLTELELNPDYATCICSAQEKTSLTITIEIKRKSYKTALKKNT